MERQRSVWSKLEGIIGKLRGRDLSNLARRLFVGEFLEAGCLLPGFAIAEFRFLFAASACFDN
jgi:hypothetical protein